MGYLEPATITVTLLVNGDRYQQHGRSVPGQASDLWGAGWLISRSGCCNWKIGKITRWRYVEGGVMASDDHINIIIVIH